MSVDKYHNQQYSGSPPDVPLRTGDRRYAQDRVLDFWFLMDSVGKVLDDMMGQLPILLSGGVVTQGAGQSLDITAGYGYAEFNVNIPLSFASTPPTKTNADLEAIKISWGAQNDINASSANCSVYTVVDDGVTTNYVKMTYLETDGNTRNRAKATGSYAYEVAPDFDLIVNGSAPGDNEILLATFTSSGGTYTITQSTIHVLNYPTIDDINTRIGTGTSTLSKSSDYTITDSDLEDTDHLIIYVDCSGGEVVISLPTLSDNQEKIISILAENVGTDIGEEIIIDGEGSETISGLEKVYLRSENDMIKIIGESSEWKILNSIGNFDVRWMTPRLVGSAFSLSPGTPALAAMSENETAFIDSSNDSLRWYTFNGVNWSLTGSGLTITGAGDPALTKLNSTDVAFIDSSLDELRTYRWNGSTWSLVGSGLSISGIGRPALAALTPTLVAFIDATLKELRTYSWSGSAWSLVGSGLSISGIGNPALARIDSNTVAFLDGTNDELRTYSWSGSAWSLVGSGLSILCGSSCALASLNNTDIVFIDSTYHNMLIYRWNGSTWSLVSTEFFLSGSGTPAVSALNFREVVFIDTLIDELKTFRFAFKPK